MPTTSRARVFMSGRSQHVTIPREFRFRSSEVAIRRDSKSGDIILTEVPSLREVFAALDAAEISHNFISDRDRRPPQERLELNRIFELDSENNGAQ
jgi:antitoxin VapB